MSSPFLAVACVPLTTFHVDGAYRIWTGGSIAAFALCAALTIAVREEPRSTHVTC